MSKPQKRAKIKGNATREQSHSTHCSVCGKSIEVQIMKNTGVCSENCRKDRDGDADRARALNP